MLLYVKITHCFYIFSVERNLMTKLNYFFMKFFFYGIVLQVCRFSCPEPQCSGSGPPTIGGPGPRIPNSPNSYPVNNTGPPPPAASFVRTPTGPPSSFSGSSVGGSPPSSYTVNNPAGSSGSYRVNAPPPPPPSNIQEWKICW